MNAIRYVFIDDEECEEAKAKICREVGKANGFDWADQGDTVLIDDDRPYADRICRICELYKVALFWGNYRTQRIRCHVYYFQNSMDYNAAVNSMSKEIGYSDRYGWKKKIEYLDMVGFYYAYILFYDNISNPKLAEKICIANNGNKSNDGSFATHTIPMPDWEYED